MANIKDKNQQYYDSTKDHSEDSLTKNKSDYGKHTEYSENSCASEVYESINQSKGIYLHKEDYTAAEGTSNYSSFLAETLSSHNVDDFISTAEIESQVGNQFARKYNDHLKIAIEHAYNENEFLLDSSDMFSDDEENEEGDLGGASKSTLSEISHNKEYLEKSNTVSRDIIDDSKIALVNTDHELNDVDYNKSLSSDDEKDINKEISSVEKTLKSATAEIAPIEHLKDKDIHVCNDNGCGNINVIEEVSKQITEWKHLARYLGVCDNHIDIIDENEDTIYEKCYCMLKYCVSSYDLPVTNWQYMRNVLMKSEDGKMAVHTIENNEISRNTEEKLFGAGNSISSFVGYKSDGEILNLEIKIADLVTDWQSYAKCLGLRKPLINTIMLDENRTWNRCIKVMEEVIRSKTDFSVAGNWLYWREYLSLFEDGKRAIIHLESNGICDPPNSDEDNLIYHEEISSNGFFIKCHFYDIEEDSQILPIDKSSTIKINIGGNKEELIEKCNFENTIQKRLEYFQNYSLFQDVSIFNCCYDECIVMATLELFFENNNGFAMKGCDFKKIYTYFGKEIPSSETCQTKERIIAYIENENVILHVEFINKENFRKIMNKNLKAIQLIRSSLESLQKLNVAHVTVFLHDETLSNEDVMKICSKCCSLKLLVPKSTFTNVSLFQEWYNENIKNDRKFVMSVSTTQVLNKCFENKTLEIKQELLMFMAIEDYNFPSFSKSLDTQVEELRKLILLSPEQFRILYSESKHFIIKGGYGCGKSLVLQKKLEQVSKKVNDSDVIYYICHDQQSQFGKHMEFVRNKISFRNLLICNNKDIHFESPRLSDLMKHVLKVWNMKKTCHLLIDEFNGYYIDYEEIERIKSLMSYFKNSYIIIASQAMENIESPNDSGHKSFDKELEAKTSFKIYNLNYAFRSSVQINNLLEDTINNLSKVPSYVNDSFIRKDRVFTTGLQIVDKEFALEVSQNKRGNHSNLYEYNQSEKCGHSIDGVKPSLYFVQRSVLMTEMIEKLRLLELLIHYILKSCKKLVLIPFDKEFYEMFYTIFVNKNNINWTASYQEFTTSERIDIFFTDYASVRGYEFENVIFVTSLCHEYLKYRMVESLSRSTTYLSVIVMPSEKIDPVMEQILESWRAKTLVFWNNVTFDEKDRYFLNDTLMEKPDSIEDFEQLLKRFPWTSAKQDEIKTYIPYEGYDLRLALKLVFKNDSVDLLHDLIKIHKIDPKNYNDSTLLHFAAQFEKPLNIVHNLICKHKLKTSSFDKHGESAFHVACKSSSLELLKTLTLIFDKHELSTKGKNALHYAAEKNNKNVVQYFKKQNIDVNLRDRNGKTPLHIAAMKNNSSVIRELIKDGSNVNAQTESSGETALHIAIRENTFDVISTLINHSDDINIKGGIFLDTPLHVASRENKFQIIKFLLDRNANINSRNKLNETPLHCLCQKGSVYMIEYLIEYPKIKARVECFDDSLDTPLHVAASRNTADVVKKILDNTSDINVRNIKSETALHKAVSNNLYDVVDLLCEYGAGINCKNSNKQTPLHIATMKDSKSVVSILLKFGADINIVDSSGRTPLEFAFENCSISIIEELVHASCSFPLCKHTCVPPTCFYSNSSLNSRKQTYLHLACNRNTKEVISYLMKPGENVNVKNESGDTALHIASKKNSAEVVQLLIQLGADIETRNNAGDTPLHMAARCNSLDVLQTLMKENNAISMRNDQEETPLHIAAAENSIQSISFLIEAGLSVNQRDFNGLTPLHIAAKENTKNIINYLLNQKGVDVNVCDKNGQTPLHFAAKENSAEVVSFLISKGAYLNWLDENGIIPIHLAAHNNEESVIATLIGNGSSVNLKNILGKSPLHFAIQANSLDVMSLLISEGAEINSQTYDGKSALHISAMENLSNATITLLENNAKVNAFDNEKLTALHYSVKENHKNITSLLIEWKADLNFKDFTGSSALHFSVKNKNKDIVTLLIEADADVNQRDCYGLSPLHIAAKDNSTDILSLLIKNNANVNIEDNTGSSPIHFSVQENSLDALSILTANGAFVNQRNHHEWTMMHFAVVKQLEEVVSFLIKRGANVYSKDVNGKTPLHLAAAKKSHIILQMLITTSTNVNFKDNDGLSPLHVATDSCCKDNIQLLIKAGASVNQQDFAGNTPMHFAAIRNSKDIILSLIEKGGDINRTNKIGQTPLHVAAKENSSFMSSVGENITTIVQSSLEDTLELLLQHQADVNSEDIYKLSPLHYATQRNSSKMVEFLLRNGALVNHVNIDGMTPLHFAINENAADVISVLFQYNANVNAKNNFGLSPLHLAAIKNLKDITLSLLINEMVQINIQDNELSTPLHYAVKESSDDVLSILLEQDVDINIQNKFGSTCLHIAAEYSLKKIALKLILRQADVNKVDGNGMTALHIALKSYSEELIPTLILFGGNVNVCNKYGCTTLHLAAEQDLTKSISLLLDNKAEINAKDKQGSTPLSYAIASNSYTSSRTLLFRGADISCKDNLGKQPLHLAAEKNSTHAVSLLLENGAEINTEDGRGLTPLHIAVEKHSADVIQILIAKGADLNYRDKLGLTPLHFAVRANEFWVTNLLIEKGVLVDREDNDGSTPLHIAVKQSSLEIISIIIAAKAYVNYSDYSDSTPLHLAVRENRLDVVSKLVSAGADVDKLDGKGKTSVEIAREWSFEEITLYLLETSKNVPLGQYAGIDIEFERSLVSA